MRYISLIFVVILMVGCTDSEQSTTIERKVSIVSVSKEISKTAKKIGSAHNMAFEQYSRFGQFYFKEIYVRFADAEGKPCLNCHEENGKRKRKARRQLRKVLTTNVMPNP